MNAPRLWLACLSLFFVVPGIVSTHAQYSLYAPRNHHLLLNGDLVASKTNVELVLGKPAKHGENPLMVEAEAWEARYGNLYPNVIFDPFEKFYKGWFGPFIVCESTAHTPEADRNKRHYRGPHAGTKRESGVLYGTSHDGVLWNKPLLDLHKWNEGDKTNILLRGAQGASVFRTSRDRSRLFSMIYRDETDGGLKIRFSANGVQWQKAQPVEAQLRTATRTTLPSGPRH